LVKSSIMVGIGERDEEVLESLRDLRNAGTDIVTLGQYLRPTPKHAAVDRYVTEAAFEEYRLAALEIGFAFVASGPLVRSSYHAAEGFVAARLRPGRDRGEGAERATRSSERPALDGGPMLTDLISPASLVRRVSV
jgi:lipoic acid synthetase